MSSNTNISHRKNTNQYFIYFVIFALFATPVFAYDEYYEYHQQQDYAQKLLNQAKDDYDRQMIYCRKNSVFTNSCAEKAKSEYLKRKHDAEQIIIESKANERRLKKDNYNRIQAQKQQQYSDKKFADKQKKFQHQQELTQRQIHKQQKIIDKDIQRQTKYLKKQQQQQNLYNRQQAKQAQRNKKIEKYNNQFNH